MFNTPLPIILVVTFLGLSPIVAMLGFSLPRRLIESWNDEIRAAQSEEPMTLPNGRPSVMSFCLAGLLCAGYAIALVFSPLQGAALVPGAIAGLLLIVVVIADARTRLIPDPLSLGVVWLGLICAALPSELTGWPLSTSESVLGAVAGYTSLWSIYKCHLALTGRHGMGYGDFKLFAGIGALVGFTLLPLVILAAAGSGLVCALALKIAGRLAPDMSIPFGPFLVVGGALAMLYGDPILAWYLSL